MLQQMETQHVTNSTEMTLTNASTGASSSPDNFVSSSAASGSNKSWIIILAITIGVIGLLTAAFIGITVIPHLENTNSASASDANTINDNEQITDSDEISTTMFPETTTLSPTPSPTLFVSTAANGQITVVNDTNIYSTEYQTENIASNCSRDCPIDTYGILNPNHTYYPGGFIGWAMYSIVGGWRGNRLVQFVESFPEIHASIGDTLHFTLRNNSWAPDDVWIVPQSVYNNCQFGENSGAVQLAHAGDIHTDSNPPAPGLRFLITEKVVNDWGNNLYFASAARWQWPNKTLAQWGCQNGVKVKVIIEPRRAIPIVSNDASTLDLASSDTIKDLTAAVGHLSRMLILNQFSDEQRIRSEGDSGLTNVRGHFDGDLTYDDGSYSNGGAASIHDHSDNSLIVGIGEIGAVLNGVEFTSRHNDYNLDMPHLTSSEYGAVEEVPRPDIPPSVLSQATISDQIVEMQEYFRAFKHQNISHRDYRSYFRAILCYIEGTWILDSNDLSEPFDSDRHSIDASTWKQLHDKIRWMMNSGRKDPSENLAHLPSSIRNLYNNTYPIISNWEYRILCHPLKDDLPTSRFRVIDDLHIQLMGTPESREDLYYSRRSRFDLNKYININDIENSITLPVTQWYSGQKTWNFLDYLMEQIPGKNNYAANLTDELPDGTERVVHYLDNSEFNSGYYNRFYSLTGADAMGSTQHRRGYSDRYLFAAQTTQSKVSPIQFEYESTSTNTFYSTNSRWSYAIPLEIIYMTPLTKWNPYGIQQVTDRTQFEYNSGECGIDPFNGYTFDNFYFTPIQFFTGIGSQGQGDTASIGVCAIGEDQQEHQVYASGHWIIFPQIGNNVGFVRQRYPIFPCHYCSNPSFKEVKALKDIILPNNYDDRQNGVEFWTNELDLIYGFDLILSGSGHYHIIHIPGWRINWKWYDENTQTYYNGSQYIIQEDSSISNTHSHTVNIWRWRENENENNWKYEIESCRPGLITDQDINYINNQCSDGHNILYRD